VIAPRIVLVHRSQRHDGHLRQFEVYLRALTESGVPFSSVVCIDPSLRDRYPAGETTITGWKVPGGGRLEMGVNRLLPIFSLQLKDLRADVVHVNDVSLAGVARYRPDVVVSVADLAKAYTDFYPRAASWLHNRALPEAEQAAAIVCHSDFVRREILSLLKVPAERIHLVPLFSTVAPEREPPPRSPEPPTDRRPWNLVYIATDRAHKNLRTYLEILSRLDARFRGVLVSRLTKPTRELARRLGLTGRLTVLHDVPRIEEIYGAAHVLLFPSLYEGFGLPLVEAMSYGVPVVASDRAAIPEIVGRGGRILPVEEAGPWVEAVLNLADPVTYRRSSSSALARSRDFSARRTALSLIPIYQSVTESSRRPLLPEMFA
jgi:glycosyltransferase involved in cell wall biosynthesis